MATASIVPDKVTRVSVDDLGSHLATLEMELSEGRSIELVRGMTVIAEVRSKVTSQASVPVEPLDLKSFDFKSQLRGMWSDRVLDVNTTAWVREDRDGTN